MLLTQTSKITPQNKARESLNLTQLKLHDEMIILSLNQSSFQTTDESKWFKIPT